MNQKVVIPSGITTRGVDEDVDDTENRPSSALRAPSPRKREKEEKRALASPLPSLREAGRGMRVACGDALGEGRSGTQCH
jgi:hypothetical protein